MNLFKIHHIAIIVSDYEAAKDFYVNKLGFSVIRENFRPERKDWKLDLRVNEYTEIEIFAEENPPKRLSRPEACGLRHLAFWVDSVEQTVKELRELGIECEPIRVDDYTGKKMTFFHDPDEMRLVVRYKKSRSSVLAGREKSLYDDSCCWRIFQSIFDVLIYGHLMGRCINEQLFMKIRGKTDVEAAFECNFRFFSFCLAGFQIIIDSTVEIIQKFFGTFTLVRNQGTNPHDLTIKNAIFF